MKRPGGALTFRPLYFYWICDASGSMSINGKIDVLNTAISECIPEMRNVASENPTAAVLLRTLKFSNGAEWIGNEPIPLDKFHWVNIKADPIQKPGLDIVFLIDTSGSMSDEIEAVKRSCQRFADQITEKGAEVRLGVVGFDIGGHQGGNEKGYKVKGLRTYTIGTWQLSSPSDFKKNISSLTVGLFGGEGCYLANQDTIDIFPEVVKTYQEGDETRVLVIISDEMGDNHGLDEIIGALQKGKIKTYVLGVPGEHGAHEQIASRTGGKFWNIIASKGESRFEGLLDVVADTIASEMTKTLSTGIVSKGTDMGEAMKLLAGSVSQASMPDRALPPVMVLVSDGIPTDDFVAGIKQLDSEPWGKKAIRMSIGIGGDVDLDVLHKFNRPSEIKPFKADNPQALLAYIRWTSTQVLRAASSPLAGEFRNLPLPNVDFNETIW